MKGRDGGYLELEGGGEEEDLVFELDEEPEDQILTIFDIMIKFGSEY